ncbi:hypothetical protein LWI28_019579 [Acer negundo]|uniref:Uncharacterized protein n=1 Tax=Acer negundo TaxID=4023 RepID=A0AAD5I7B5_ACENE|nr:hypothetical protein LWI28_019579 [Acer negundo]KAK4833508.1 hypothetical protein QYF36_006192 [Acer negundo]
MGLSFSCPLSDFDDLDTGFEAVLLRKSISFTDEDVVMTALQSLSFSTDRDHEPASHVSEKKKKMIIQPLPSFKGRELETSLSFETPPSSMENLDFGSNNQSPMRERRKSENCLSKLGDRRDQAALKLQKVYKSFRTRRQLADCAVVVEQRWWKLLDFAELKRSSISFFDIEKPESAISRWSRARTRAAKLGKGLSKDEKARKLALQHWLEAIDPRHRYGHNLQFYYVTWLHCESYQPFFYWLDVGEGREIHHERCPRSKLQQQCIKYLGPTERTVYEVAVEDGKFIYKQSEKHLDTTGGPPDAKWIFVLSTSKTLYVGQKNKGTFQHSSFLAGGATLSAGRLVVVDGILKAVWPHSGHYLPTEENFQEFMSFLREHNVDLSNVERNPAEAVEESIAKRSNSLRKQDTEQIDIEVLAEENIDSRTQDSDAAENLYLPMSRLSQRISSKITKLKVPARSQVFDTEEALPENWDTKQAESPRDDGYETAEESFLTETDFMVTKKNLFDEDDFEEEESPISKDKIMERIDSHKGMKSYQLAQQLSSKWSTGAGPRIGCMRDYPSELRFRVLEHANLSPRARSASPRSRSMFSSPTPTSLRREAGGLARKSPLATENVAVSETATRLDII